MLILPASQEVSLPQVSTPFRMGNCFCAEYGYFKSDRTTVLNDEISYSSRFKGHDYCLFASC